ncbi:MAG: response regulator transcription factor [Flavobacteriaceae bacterium]
MENKIKILVVDDHQLIIDGIVASLSKFDSYEVTATKSCDDALQRIKQHAKTAPFTILFTDLSFDNVPKDAVLDGGESLIKEVNRLGIEIKIAVISGHTETNRVYNVISNLQPDAYILKTHTGAKELDFAIKKIMNNERFYTYEIHQKILKRSIVQIQMDEVAVQILSELPKHPKMSNLEGIIKKEGGGFLKLRSIENKLANLRIDLNANNNTDLVLKAKELGIID